MTKEHGIKRRGRPKKTAAEMKASGAKPSVWKRREAQEQAANRPLVEAKAKSARAEAVKYFLDLADRVNATFADRLDYRLMGYSKTLEPVRYLMPLANALNGRQFCWEAGYPLAIYRSYAEEVVNGTRKVDAEDLKMCQQFVHELEHGVPGFVLDPAESDLLDAGILAFAADNPPSILSSIAILTYASWKTPTGEYRFSDHANPFSFTESDVALVTACEQAYHKHLAKAA